MWWGVENTWEESAVGDVVKRIAKRKVLLGMWWRE
jgi:phage protein D